MYSITIIFSYKFKIVNNKKAIYQQQETKPMVETKTVQKMRDIELHFTKEEKKDTNKKIKNISIEIKRM